MIKKTDAHIRNKMNTIIRNCYGRIKNGEAYIEHSYKDKGIEVYEEWHNTLKFLKWSKSNGYFKGAWLLRYDKNKDYCPENCFWGTEEQSYKLNCSMIKDIEKKLENTPVEKIADKYQICNERVRQIRRGKRLKICDE